MYCTKNQFPPSSFCGPHKKTHGERGLGKHYNMRFVTKLGHVPCAIRCIPCVCTKCTPILDEIQCTGVSPHQQPKYQPVKYCTDWPVLGSFNNCKIFNFHIRRHIVNISKIIIRLYLAISVTAWLYWFKQVNMATLIQQIRPQWDIMF